ncbi:MAG TPA: abortive infection family protein [Methylomirabilota bacterium]|nr:abortive infection family protein [Methylomirabilota bacterium]
MPLPDPLVAKVEALQNLLVSHATGGGGDYGDYEELRRELLNNPLTGTGLPRFVHTCRNLAQFWQFIKFRLRSYAERREYIWEEFRPLIESVEARTNAPLLPSDQQVLSRLSPESVQTVWQRALERRISDPEGAITSARGLLETVCKHILDDLAVRYDDAADLPKLYRLTSESLNIAPSQHTAQVFKQILGGCTSVVEGLAALRNRLGDAHGGGRSRVRPAPRHAQLAVNLAGSMTSFLVATWEARKNAGT